MTGRIAGLPPAPIGAGARPRGRTALWAACGLAVALALAVAGCGYRTAPKPISSRIPPPQDVRIWTRDDHVLVAWKTLPDALKQRWGGVDTYRISISRLPLGCPDCDPVEQRDVALAPDAKDLTVDKDVTVYHFTPGGPPATWLVRVSVHFNDGSGPQATPAVVDAVGTIPVQPLHWERVTADTYGSGGKPGIRLFWDAHRERIVHVITPSGGQENRNLMYRVNIYRRVPPAPWPPLPVNATPVEGLFWFGPEPIVLNDSTARSVEYEIRLVDQQGNEGPASDPISIPILKGPGL